MIDSPPILQKSLELARALYPTEDRDLRTFHVSTIWRRNQLLSVGINNSKTHSRNLKNPKFNREGQDISEEKLTCSELNSVLRLGKIRYTLDFSRCILINVRITRESKVGLARCCSSCTNLVKYLGFKRVFHTNDDGNFELYKI